MKKDLLVTIITVVFNGEKHIEDGIVKGYPGGDFADAFESEGLALVEDFEVIIDGGQVGPPGEAGIDIAEGDETAGIFFTDVKDFAPTLHFGGGFGVGEGQDDRLIDFFGIHEIDLLLDGHEGGGRLTIGALGKGEDMGVNIDDHGRLPGCGMKGNAIIPLAVKSRALFFAECARIHC